MPGYTAQDLEQARKPFRDAHDRDLATCVLGHLMTEQREAHNAERAEIIAGISAAVQAFDARAKLGVSAPSPASTAAPAPALATAEPPIAPAAPVPAASLPYGAQRRDARAPVRAGSIDLLGTAPSGAPAPTPVDLVADMKRRHGKT